MKRTISYYEKDFLQSNRDFQISRGYFLQENVTSLNFDEIYKEYGKKILNLAYRMTSSEETARDMTQDIFIKVYKNLAAFKGESNVYTWIYRIALNHIMSYLKKEKRYKFFRLIDKSVTEILHEDMIEPRYLNNASISTPDEILEKTERDKIINSIIDSLSPKYRIPFILFRYEELSYKEISEQLGLSIPAVEARIHRAKKKLIEKLEPWLKHL
jgi:RNA polymerase sigma-70 factor, ECF subfamily